MRAGLSCARTRYYDQVFADAHRWPDFEHCLEAITALVMLEGVSPYIKATSFDQFLRFLRR
jgi:O-methyltransferase involved in polyketide biosynthesis